MFFLVTGTPDRGPKKFQKFAVKWILNRSATDPGELLPCRRCSCEKKLVGTINTSNMISSRIRRPEMRMGTSPFLAFCYSDEEIDQFSMVLVSAKRIRTRRVQKNAFFRGPKAPEKNFRGPEAPENQEK